MESEQDVIGCVGDENGTAILPEIRKTNEWYLRDQPNNEFRPDKVNKDWSWLQNKMFQMVNIVNDSVFHFDVDGLSQTIIGLDGFAGQNILIDVDNEKIIVINSKYADYDWEEIVYEKYVH